MSSIVVVSVHGDAVFPAVLVHHQGTEVVGEDLLAGPQKQGEAPDKQTPVTFWTFSGIPLSCDLQPVQSIKADQLLLVSLLLDVPTLDRVCPQVGQRKHVEVLQH